MSTVSLVSCLSVMLNEVYRCYIIFFRNWKVVVIPACLWMAAVVISGVGVWNAISSHPDALLEASSTVMFLDILLGITFSTNLIATGTPDYHTLV